MFWPDNLAIYYPYPQSIPVWQVGVAVVMLVSITTAAIWLARKCPYFITGWLWYLGTLVPVLGIKQAGLWPALADRWVYVPFIGLFMTISWGGAAIIAYCQTKYRLVQSAALILIFFVFVGMTVLTKKQVEYWENVETLFQHADNVTSNNDFAYQVLGTLTQDKEVAQGYLSKALCLSPLSPWNYYEMGLILFNNGNLKESIWYFEKSIKLYPDFPAANHSLTQARAAIEELDKAIRFITVTIEAHPRKAELHVQLGNLYRNNNNIDSALNEYQKALAMLGLNLTAPDIQKKHNLDKFSDKNKSKNKQLKIAHIYYYIAAIYSYKNQVDIAIRWIDRALTSGFNNFFLLKTDSMLDNVRKT
ncbi:MAG: hypothetical protein KAI17_27545, partial [Thiotrichaceae bacterium]|nr:hypothetical protein [Thiotrichaceae bacterium]